jgi:hypothetical protein
MIVLKDVIINILKVYYFLEKSGPSVFLYDIFVVLFVILERGSSFVVWLGWGICWFDITGWGCCSFRKISFDVLMHIRFLYKTIEKFFNSKEKLEVNWVF